MKKKAASLLILTLLSGLTAFQCDRNVDCCDMPPCSEKETLTGSWYLEYFLNAGTGGTDRNPQLGEKEVVFTFSDNEKEGTIEGHTFANEVFGRYKLEPGCMIKITEFGGTKVGEPGWSSKAWLNSDATGNYQISGDRLTLSFTGMAEQMVFRKK